MIDVLKRAIADLPLLLGGRQRNTLLIDYEPPVVERVWFNYGDYRLNLHKIYPLDRTSEAKPLWHPHPWPSIMLVVDGKYKMEVGLNELNTATDPPSATTLILPAGSLYEMSDARAWHSVEPLDSPAWSIMLTGKPFVNKQSAVERDKPKTPLLSLPKEKEEEIVNYFNDIHNVQRIYGYVR